MDPSSTSTVWPILHYDDPNAAVRFLVDVLGFHEVLVATDAGGDVVHAELAWPGGGALVLGGTKHTDSVHGHLPAGMGAVYVVTDDIPDVHRRVVEAGGDVVEGPHEIRFGSGATSLTLTVRDSEANLWTFGTHRGSATHESATSAG